MFLRMMVFVSYAFVHFQAMSSELYVLGPGSLGLALGCFWSKANHDVNLIGKKPLDKQYVDVVCRHEKGVDSQLVRFKSATQLDKGSIDTLVVATKAYDTVEALKSVQHALHDDTVIILYQNGYGQHQGVQALLPHHTVYQAVTTMTAVRQGPLLVDYSSKGGTFMGLLQGQPAIDIEQRLLSADLPIRYVDSIFQPLWTKLFYNLVINTLCGVHNIPMGELNSNAQIAAIKDQMIDEFFMLVDKVDLPVNKETLVEGLNSLIERAASHSPSMRQDLSSHKKTEVDYISGYILLRARDANVSMPTIQKVHDQLKALEENGYQH